MFLRPKTLFFLMPTPRRLRESESTEGNETPVLESSAGSVSESEPQSGRREERFAKKKLAASSRNGDATPDETAIEAAAPAPASARVTAAALRPREVGEGVRGGRLMG